ncbi:MAG: hypothetical protein QXQ69_02705 [Candidatus Aenigmatarchaeota archaeon]
MSWDGNFYVDESVKTLNLQDKQKRKITIIGAGVGIKTDNVELLDWRGIAYYQPNGNNKFKNGNGYWSLLGKETLELILNKSHDYKPEKVYVCNQIAFYVMKAALSFKSPTREIKSLVKRMVPVTHRGYRGYNGIYKTKQKVGKLVKRKLTVKLSSEDIAKILQGMLYDLRRREMIEL